MGIGERTQSCQLEADKHCVDINAYLDLEIDEPIPLTVAAENMLDNLEFFKHSAWAQKQNKFM